jgi:hypothetical protein
MQKLSAIVNTLTLSSAQWSLSHEELGERFPPRWASGNKGSRVVGLTNSEPVPARSSRTYQQLRHSCSTNVQNGRWGPTRQQGLEACAGHALGSLYLGS